MAQFAPIDYGPAVQADTVGARAVEEASQFDNERRTNALRNFGDRVTEAGQTVAQTVLHRQVLGATTKAAEGTEKAINVIETNPYVITRDTLMRNTDPETVDALWQKAQASGAIDKDADGHEFVPTHVIGRDLYAAMTKKSREEAAQDIGLTGWRNEFLKTAETEALNKQERWVDPKLAAHQVEYTRAKTLESIDRTVALAMTPDDFKLPIAYVQTSPSLSPPEKVVKTQELQKRSDMVTATVAMRNPVANYDTLQEELTKLQGPDAEESYKYLDPHERLGLLHQVQTAIRMADLQTDAAKDAKKQADKEADDSLLAEATKQMATGRMDPSQMFADPGHPKGSLDAFWSQLKTKEGAEGMFHIIEAFQKNQQAGRDKDAPGSYSALMSLYVNSPDDFKAAIMSRGKVNIPGYGEFNPAADLSPGSMHHFMDKVAGLADKSRSEADRKDEEKTERRLFVAMTTSDGGAISPVDLARDRPQYAEMEQFIRDTMSNEEKSAIEKGKHLSPEQKTTVMVNAAKEFRESSKHNLFGNPHPESGVQIETETKGAVTLPLLERTAMEQARREAGGVGATAIKSDGADYYDNYKDVIERNWADKVKDENLTPLNSYRLYYAAKKLGRDGRITDPDTQVKYLLIKHSRAEAAKQSGGSN